MLGRSGMELSLAGFRDSGTGVMGESSAFRECPRLRSLRELRLDLFVPGENIFAFLSSERGLGFKF